MTATNARPANGGRKVLLDLVFTLIIPIAILSPNLLGSGFAFADVLGGTVRAYLVAALIPVAYTAFDLLIHRSVSPIALWAGATALVTGALAFWYVDGPLYAFKDSVLRFLIALFAVASVAFRYPLFRLFLDASSVTAGGEERAAMNTAFGQPSVTRALGTGTLALALAEFISGVANYVVNLHIVTATFGSKDFNAQVAEANAVMRIPSVALFLAGFAVAAYLVQLAVTKRYGKGASIFEPGQLAEKIREDGGRAGA